MVSEEEIEAALKLGRDGNLDSSLVLSQELLRRAETDVTRILLLLQVITCSALLGLDKLTDEAAADVERLVGANVPQVWVNLQRATRLNETGRPTEALELISMSLESQFVSDAAYCSLR
jgi:plasmid maintenance system antidote protein VapI